ncbi:hypothetical protein N7510_004763 [Penicillium lagena]|uniref:uncharacterized protein n=1 Tax=Penicillium lagena TaxID=94218 RepID=UPI002540526C|nr:uncharacterized protein N7510_004763 [Penicillium lagena]KAJ5620779.1 hypothetical protein N7510_004763 [Penicillium lagena]
MASACPQLVTQSSGFFAPSFGGTDLGKTFSEPRTHVTLATELRNFTTVLYVLGETNSLSSGAPLGSVTSSDRPLDSMWSHP